jgi:uncharacterized small protein (TIGR04563 family)
MATEKQKQSLYFPDEMLREIVTEANRLDRSLSWTVQQAWRLARLQLAKFPAAGPRVEAEPERAAQPPPPPEPPRDESWGEPSAQVREFLKGKFESGLVG